MPDGSPLKDMSAMFSRALKAAHLLYSKAGDKRTLYSLRHTAINDQIRYSGLDALDIAENVGNSVTIIQLYYKDLNDDATREKLAGYDTIGREARRRLAATSPNT